MDAVGGEAVGLFRETETKPFALIRIVTTPARFRAFAGDTPGVGDWYFLDIRPANGSSGLLTWHAQLEGDGYSSHSRGLTVEAYRLESRDDGPTRRRSLGAAVAPRRTLPKHIDDICGLPPAPTSLSLIKAVLKNVPAPVTVSVRDVGQASFVSLLNQSGNAILHFDVGFPISFNRHTAPKAFASDASEKPVVVLSHWDWDHLHAAFALPHLLDCKWIVPSQRLGPGAARLAVILAARHNLLVWPLNSLVTFPGGLVMDCNGGTGSPNDTGLCVCVKLANGRIVLLTGDADYEFLPAAYAQLGPITHMVATHHGARLKSKPKQIPAGAGGTLVVSYGTRNVYRHPHHEAIQAHAAAGWTVWESTAGRRGIAQRGDRYLT